MLDFVQLNIFKLSLWMQIFFHHENVHRGFKSINYIIRRTERNLIYRHIMAQHSENSCGRSKWFFTNFVIYDTLYALYIYVCMDVYFFILISSHKSIHFVSPSHSALSLLLLQSLLFLLSSKLFFLCEVGRVRYFVSECLNGPEFEIKKLEADLCCTKFENNFF